MTNKSIPSGFHPIRRDRLPLETVMDSYKAKGKLSEPTVCPDCGAVFRPDAGNGWRNPRMRIRQPVRPVIACMIISRRAT